MLHTELKSNNQHVLCQPIQFYKSGYGAALFIDSLLGIVTVAENEVKNINVADSI